MPPRPWVIVIFCGDDISFDWKSFWCRPSPPTRFILYFQKHRNSFRSRDVLSQNSQSETLFLRGLVAEISTHRGDFVSYLWSSNSMRSTETTAHLFLLNKWLPSRASGNKEVQLRIRTTKKNSNPREITEGPRLRHCNWMFIVGLGPDQPSSRTVCVSHTFAGPLPPPAPF